MGKSNRGKALEKLPSKGRGECPICFRKRIKLLYEYEMENDGMVKVCKNCRQKSH
ncbi:hypothetical protein JSQ81_01825 [Sporosarcina sp. Marseille-Q4063]|uniref:hypothetical protein n=1 Tax=Sporosarcina sp. Marseille-Q4063 TaxID=2810514 RepID=UPI001BAF6F6B|nr:hypothetical protein [Sporosarcina sp. Marseille-Q4063]QUW22355.1 hypothetical protein JSQ81_01825 [Sporosarcina sp. Marseille-Q4063]